MRFDLDFGLDDVVIREFGGLARAFRVVEHSTRTWDVTTCAAVLDNVRARTIAGQSINREPVRLDLAQAPFVDGRWQALRFGNANGEDLYLYPGFVMVHDRGGNFALIEIDQVDLQNHLVRFNEDEGVPPDARVVGHTWLKANKDNTPDRRFRDNRQIPVVSAYLGRHGGTIEMPAAAAGGAVEAARPLPRLDEVCAGYAGSRILNNVSLEVGEGEVVALLGRNGVGKTTTLRTIMGTLKAESGRIEFGDSEITRRSPDRINREGLSIVPEGRRIFPNLTVMEPADRAAPGRLEHGRGLRPVPQARDPAGGARREPERRRAPDAGDRTRAHGADPAHPARRAA